MPLLGRLFTRKNKNTPRGAVNDDTQASSTLGSPTAVSDSNHSSHTGSSYITPDISTPSDPNAKNPVRGELGGGRLRLFNRKKSSNVVLEQTTLSSELSTPQFPTFPRLSDVDSDPSDVRRLRPPPSRSAIFAAYADPGSALSTRSLPENSFPKITPFLSSPPPPLPLPQKRPSFFAWAKPSTSSSLKSAKNNDDPFNARSDSPDSRTGSFNLKSFKHLRPPSPPFDVSAPDVSLVPPIPRPRGSSMHSDRSQRISVAAFREAQARRSHNGSPIPSPHESSPIPAQGAVTPGGTRAIGNGPRTSRSSAALLQHDHTKRSSTAVASTTDDDDFSDDSSEEDDVHRRANDRLGPGKSKSKSKSETGHGSTRPLKKLNDAPPLPRASQSHVGHASNPRPFSHFELRDDPMKPGMHPRSQSSLGVYGNQGRRGASNSTSPLTSTTATHQQSASVPSNLRNPSSHKVSPPQLLQQRSKSAIYPPPRDSSDSDDDAPLATFVPPRRPGSAMSSHSNPRSASGHSQATARSPSQLKPLINVNELITSKPTSVTSPPSDAAFTQGPTLLSRGKSATTTTHGTLVIESPKLGETKQARTAALVKAVSPPSSPVKEMKVALPQSLEGTDTSDCPSQKSLQGKETGQQKRDPLSDRLSRAVKKSLTSPPSPSVPPSTLPVPNNTSLSRERSQISGIASSETLQMRRSTEASRVVLPRNPAPTIQSSPEEYSPPDEDLAKLLGTAGIKFISRAGESSESEYSEEDKQKEKDRIAPIPIKRRTPPPAFTVTSRPSLLRQEEQQSNDTPSRSQSPKQTETRATQPKTTLSDERQRGSTLTPFPSFPSSNAPGPESDLTVSRNLTSTGTDISSKNGNSNGQVGVVTSLTAAKVERTTSVQPALARQRSNTMVPSVSSHVQKPFNVLDQSLATIRGNSPSSSTGDSSSGRTPHTPQDGSDLGVQDEKVRRKATIVKDSTSTASGLGIKRQNAHVKRRSVSFEDSLHELNTRPSRSHIREGARVGSDALDGRGGSHLREGALDNGNLSDEEKEARRKERRRKEAKNAIELGNVIHGPPPVLDDDNNDMPLNRAMDPRLSSFSPLMGMGSPMTLPMGFGPNPGGWASGMLSPAQFMVPRPPDPNLLMAHQQAMMYAKQAYQMAVAQQAMAAAGEEWERGSAIGSFGGSVFGGSTAPPMINSSLGMMQGMGTMGPAASAGWSSSASVYGEMGGLPRFGSHLTPGDAMLTSSRSDYGGSSRSSANWSHSRSVYGESYGTANASNETYSRKRNGSHSATMRPQRNSGRDSSTFPPVPPIPSLQGVNARGTPEFRGPTRLRTSSQPATPTRTNALPRRAPPSSWRLAGT